MHDLFLKLHVCDPLKRLCESLKDIVTDVHLKFTVDGISMQAVEACHVTLICFFLEAKNFDLYECRETYVIRVNMGAMHTVFKCASGDDAVSIFFNDESTNLSFVFENITNDRILKFRLRLYISEKNSVEEPDSTYSSIFQLHSSYYKKIMTDLMSFRGESVHLDLTKEGLKFTINGEDGEGLLFIKHSTRTDKSKTTLYVDAKENVSMVCGMRHLLSFSKAQCLSEKVVGRMAIGKPLQIEFTVGRLGYLRFYLAPRVSDTSEEYWSSC